MKEERLMRGKAWWSKGMEECEMACFDGRPGEKERWWKGL